MDNFVKRLASLCSVKSIVTLVLTGVFAYYNTYYGTTGDQQWAKFKERLEEELEMRYNKLGDVKSQTYRKALDKLIKKGLVKGKGGSGESLVIDMSEDMIRTLVILDRAGNFDR